MDVAVELFKAMLLEDDAEQDGYTLRNEPVYIYHLPSSTKSSIVQLLSATPIPADAISAETWDRATGPGRHRHGTRLFCSHPPVRPRRPRLLPKQRAPAWLGRAGTEPMLSPTLNPLNAMCA
jgi:hypothetical protein